MLSICQLDDESLLKIGADLSNLLELSLKHSQEAFTLAKQVIERIGSKENDMVVFALNNKDEVLLSSPSLIKEVAFDLVKYYFKSQPAAVEVEIQKILKLCVQSSISNIRVLSELITELHQD